MSNPGALLASTVTATAALGFVPVAIHFDFFTLLNEIGPVASAEQLTDASNQKRTAEEKSVSPLCLRLTQDTMFAMAGLGLCDMIDEDTFGVNEITTHIVAVPSAVHGMLHFTTEPIFAAAFLMRQLRDTHFKYPFLEKQTPTQYGYKLLGEDEFINEHTYTIMVKQGRMESFDKFMEGKFGKFGSMPERVRSFHYDLDNAIMSKDHEAVIVDVGGGRGQTLLEVQDAYPHLEARNLILQEFQPDFQIDGLTVMKWDFKDGSPQPVRGAMIYSLTHILHNLPDLEALQLLKKISDAMASYSRLLIHEFSKNSTYGKMHATMIELYAGRIRSSREWKQMAVIAGLEVTFEAYPVAGEGLVEMRKLAN